MQWHYQGIGKAADYQFRAYDLNRCLITRDKYCPNIKNDFGTVSAEFFAQYANGYDRPRSDNTVLINVFNWNEKWKVEVREVETGNRLPVEQVDTYDPLHTIHFNMNRMNTNSTAMTFPTLLTSHMVRGGLLLAHDRARNHRDRRIRPQLYRNDVAPARTLRYVRLPAVVTAAVRTEAERGGRLRSDRRPCAAAEGVRIPIHLFI